MQFEENEKYDKIKLSKLGRSVFEPTFQNSLNVWARTKVFFRIRRMSELESVFLDVRKTATSADTFIQNCRNLVFQNSRIGFSAERSCEFWSKVRFTAEASYEFWKTNIKIKKNEVRRSCEEVKRQKRGQEELKRAPRSAHKAPKSRSIEPVDGFWAPKKPCRTLIQLRRGVGGGNICHRRRPLKLLSMLRSYRRG